MLHPSQSSIVIHYLPQLIGLIYFFVFWPLLFQMKGLFGKRGILPMAEYLESIYSAYRAKSYYYIPSLFWFDASDAALMAAPALGTVLSALTFFGFFPLVWLPILFLLHLSITTAGQEFLSFGWESFFLEISFYSFLLFITPSPSIGMWVCLNLLLFRFHFEAGVSKLMTRDKNWRNLTAIDHHYLSQPIPNALAWYAKKLPMGFQKFTCFMMFLIELPWTFFVFGNEEMRLLAFLGFFGLQFFIWLTGNFSYLNHMTVIFCLILLSDTWLRPLTGAVPLPEPNPMWLEILFGAFGGLFVLGQLIRVISHFYPLKAPLQFLKKLNPFRLVNRYGIFAVMTTGRQEVTILGSEDGEEWKEYLFKWKPSEPERRPRRVSPYQPRLDWQIWFLPFTVFVAEPWIKKFLFRLLEGSPGVLKLLRHNPFPKSPPKYIRAQLYDYDYTTFEERQKTGNWWKRTRPKPYSPVFTSLDEEPFS